MLPSFIDPMLAQAAEAPFDSDKHLFEVKWDGIRCLAFVENGRVRLQSRRLFEITHKFPELACLGRLSSGTVLDGELDRGQPVDREFLRKTAKLVQEHTQSGAIEDPTKFHALNAKALEVIARQKQSDTVKVFNLLKALANLVNVKAGGEPYLISIGDRAQDIAEAFESRQMTTQQALDLLEKLISQLKAAEKDRDSTGLSPEAFAVFYVLKTDGVKEPLKAAQAVEAAFQQYPHWQTSEHQEQDVRRSIYKALIDAGIEAVVEVATKLMKLLRRASP